MRDVASVRFVGVGGAHEAHHATLAHRELVNKGGVRAAREVVHEHALSQPALRKRRHRRQLEVGDQCLENGGAGDDDVGAIRAEPGHAATLGERHAAQQLDGLAQVGQRHGLFALRFAAVQHLGRHGRQVADGAGRAVGHVNVEAAYRADRVH